MKSFLTLCAVLAFALRASGQTTYQPPPLEVPLIPTTQSNLPNVLLGVVIEGWHYDPALKTATLHLVNNSYKDVTAFNISIAEKYADGSTNYLDGTPSDIHDHQMMEDMLMAMINIQTEVVPQGSGTLAVGSARSVGAMREVRQGVEGGNGTFAAGTSRDYVDHVGKDVSDIDAVVDVVAYADGTAQVQNNDRGLRNLLGERKGQLLAMQRVVEVSKRVLADPMVVSPLDAVIQQLTPLVDSADMVKNRPPEDAEGNVAMHLRNDLKNFEMIQRSQIWSQINISEREWLARYVEQHEKRIELMKPHCEIAIPK